MTSGPSASLQAADDESYQSAAALAHAFGAVVFEPAWWPADTDPIGYQLSRFPGHDVYRIGALRHDGIPLFVVGRIEVPGAGRTSGSWYAPPELEDLRGLIGQVGVPARLQGVVHDAGQAIDLIGYDTEDEIIRAVASLRQVQAG